MSARSSPVPKLLGAFLVCVVVILGIALVAPVLAGGAPGTSTSTVVAACLLLGLAWMVIGWMFVPSVETYVGQGAMKGVPIIGPSFANPERSDPVLRDLRWKLSAETDAGIVVAALGFVLMTIGILVRIDPAAGLVALLGYGALLAAALVLAFRATRRPAAA